MKSIRSRVVRACSKSIYLLIFLLAACQSPALLVAGSGDRDVIGYQDGAGNQVRFNNVRIAYQEGSRQGLFISDGENHRIRFMDASGKVTTFAGTGKTNTKAIQSKEIHSLNSDMFYPGAIHIRGNSLYFSSPGCIRKVDLSQSDENLQIETLHGSCMTEEEWEKIRNLPLSQPREVFQGTFQDMVVDESENIYGAQSSFVYKITKNGMVERVERYFENYMGMVMGDGGRPYVFFNEYPSGPSEQPEVDVFEIKNDNSARLIGKTKSTLTSITGDGKGGFYFVTPYYGEIFRLDQNLASIKIGVMPSSKDSMRTHFANSMAYSKRENKLYIADEASIYSVNLMEKKP